MTKRKAVVAQEKDASTPDRGLGQASSGITGGVGRALQPKSSDPATGSGSPESGGDRPPIPAFTPVPRRYRHDGWTPERQKAFIEALADTGCVDRAARMVNIAQTNCYALRRAPGAESFRKAWDAALDFVVPKLKDIAFQRVIEGVLVPVFSGGKLMGFQRKYDNRLLMFVLRHYGQDADGKRVTVNYFSTRASAGAGSLDGAREERGGVSTSLDTNGARLGAAAAEASTTSVRTVISGGGAPGSLDADSAAAVLEGFEGVALDPQAQAEIGAALEACAARMRASREARDRGGAVGADALEDDPEVPFVRAVGAIDYRGTLEPVTQLEEFVPFTPGESDWELAGAEVPAHYAQWLDRQEAKALTAGEGRSAPADKGGKGAD